MSSTSTLNIAIENVMDMIDALGLFAAIHRGALTTGNDLSCEIGPTTPESVWLDKNKYIPIDLTINVTRTRSGANPAMRTFDVIVHMTFTDGGTATVTLDSSQNYSLELSSGVVTKA